MICLGLTDADKATRVRDYAVEHHIARVFVLGQPLALDLTVPVECVAWPDLIKYRFYYRLLQEVDGRTLLVVNECLRTQKRYDLTYNCIRAFLNQTSHQLVFQYLPLIDTAEDFAILFDFDSRSRWRREPLERLPLGEVMVERVDVAPNFVTVDVPTPEAAKASYAKCQRELINGIGLRDPHTIPRNLYLMGGVAKAACVDPAGHYVGRNRRMGLSSLCTFRESCGNSHVVFEFPHDFIVFSDHLARTRQRSIDVLVADLNVDRWYFHRFTDWSNRIRDAYATIQR